MPHIATIQFNAGPDPVLNIERIEALLRQAAKQGAELACLPENALARNGERGFYRKIAEQIDRSPTLIRLGELARELQLGIHLGTLYTEESETARTGRIGNTSVLIGTDGQVIASYRKMHLFDVQTERVRQMESNHFVAGDTPVVADTPWGRIGFATCYDIRFPELFRCLAVHGAEIVLVPANFTRATGKPHWMPLLQARAIENGIFIASAAQIGEFPNGFLAHGNSTVIDPWGCILHQADGESEGVHLVDIDLKTCATVRTQIPVLQHRRPEDYLRCQQF